MAWTPPTGSAAGAARGLAISAVEARARPVAAVRTCLREAFGASIGPPPFFVTAEMAGTARLGPPPGGWGGMMTLFCLSKQSGLSYEPVARAARIGRGLLRLARRGRRWR